jgi:hypothetical protein
VNVEQRTNSRTSNGTEPRHRSNGTDDEREKRRIARQDGLSGSGPANDQSGLANDKETGQDGADGCARTRDSRTKPSDCSRKKAERVSEIRAEEVATITTKRCINL